MIKVDHLSFSYEHGRGKALDDVSLSIEPGDFVGIIGESGAGKSTLGHCMNGVVPHYYHGDYYGSVTVDGMDVFDVKLTDISRVLGTVSQDTDGSMVAAVVEDEILYGLENFGFEKEQIEARVEQTLDQVGISDLRDRKISTLSGGQKQKVALAAVLALRPKIILLDEPTAELDPKSSLQIFNLLKELNEAGTTVVIVEQKVMLLSEYAKHLVVMEHGRIALSGTVAEVLTHVDMLQALGVNCPRVALMGARLQERGLLLGSIPTNVSDADDLVRRVLA